MSARKKTAKKKSGKRAEPRTYAVRGNVAVRDNLGDSWLIRQSPDLMSWKFRETARTQEVEILAANRPNDDAAPSDPEMVARIHTMFTSPSGKESHVHVFLSMEDVLRIIEIALEGKR